MIIWMKKTTNPFIRTHFLSDPSSRELLIEMRNFAGRSVDQNIEGIVSILPTADALSFEECSPYLQRVDVH